MIPKLTAVNALPEKINEYLLALSNVSPFNGEIDKALSTRLVLATDNSVYQVVPQAVIFPKSQTDIEAIFQLASQPQYQDITFSPRGGGTGTNGQSLCAGIIIDCSRHMNRIIELNLEQGWVTVEPGVVLDQLNDYLKPHQKFFAPTLSPSSRATLGGMVNTDACGKGSRLYGKTSQHVLELTAVYPDGYVHTSQAIDVDELVRMKQLPGRVSKLYQQLEQTVTEHHETITTQIPKLDRFVTGYNLDRIYTDNGKRFNLNAVLTGAEGTLAVISKIKLRLTDIPRYKCLYVVLYPKFSEALEHAKHLVTANPEAIETMDSTVLNLAKTDISYHKVARYIDSHNNMDVAAMNLIEFVGNSKEEIESSLAKVSEILAGFEHHFIEAADDIKNLWEVRKSSVGLLGKVKGDRKPQSGVEDTVVPPEHLADYIAEFRELLDKHHLKYGMFGHIDVGCLHVRPAFNLMDPNDQQIYYEITEQVAKLTQKYHGVLWGEHGKGFRSEYVPLVFGDTLYQELRKIKAATDPFNQLNPSKIAVPEGVDTELAKVRSDATRARYDVEIDDQYRQPYHLALSCNGNGACFNYSPNNVMCPSYKITRDRRHSPKGRASLIREWLRQVSLAQEENKTLSWLQKNRNSQQKHRGEYDFSHEVYEAMEGCLACQACKSQCPVNIDVPSFKAKFLQAYHSRYARNVKDYLVAYSEHMAYFQSYFPKLNNLFLSNSWIKTIIAKTIGFVEPPLLSSPSLAKLLKQNEIPVLDLNKLPSADNTVVFIQDWVTSFYEADLVLKSCLLIKKLGFNVYVMPWFANGKTFHVKGMLDRFQRIVRESTHKLSTITQAGLPMVGLDPTMVLTFRFEYPEYSEIAHENTVLLFQEWLANVDKKRIKLKQASTEESYNLLSHCTELANCDNATRQWQEIFQSMGMTLIAKQIGCCGMAGAYGHELEHQRESKGLFELTWQDYFTNQDSAAKTLVDGYSCRAQVQRMTGIKALHPLEVLLERLD